MRPETLAEAVERIRDGAARNMVLAEFADTFYLATTVEQRYATIEQEPALTGDARLDALVGGIAEYLAKQHRLGRVPKWAGAPERYLEKPWHTCNFEDPGMREYLTFAAPASSPRAISSPKSARCAAPAARARLRHRS